MSDQWKRRVCSTYNSRDVFSWPLTVLVAMRLASSKDRQQYFLGLPIRPRPRYEVTPVTS